MSLRWGLTYPSILSSSFPSPSSTHLCFSPSNSQVQPGEACCQATAQSVWLKLWFPIYHLRDWCGSSPSDALRSSCGGPEHGSSTRAKLIFTVKWDIWFTRRRPASSSNSSSEELRLQNRPKLHPPRFFFSLPLACLPRSYANLLWHRIKLTSPG